MPHAPQDLLTAYDRQLRTDAETPHALAVERLGPLRLVTLPGGCGYVTYPHLDGADPPTLRTWVTQALQHYAQHPGVTEALWRTRDHDHVPGLHRTLLDHGFASSPPESILIGSAQELTHPVPLPPGVTLRTVWEEAEVRAMSAMQDEAFGAPVSAATARALLHHLSLDVGMELWVAESGGGMISSGRLEPVPGTDFAGIWGGATLAPWRGRGIYRALTAARARSALRMGKHLLHSHSNENSRPILERAGLVKVSTATTYHWYP